MSLRKIVAFMEMHIKIEKIKYGVEPDDGKTDEEHNNDVLLQLLAQSKLDAKRTKNGG